ncbi:hypothetical protein [Rhodococcus sp. X156]|uniref:hypothetical protein n=1 Tax=Rhodococcus sp. X156 TaxID=2499145 RepID=UPI000FDA014B|nr:hypothetical protein [Rhodococcus sp. X156]
MTAYDELTVTGRCGPATLALLHRLVSEVTAARTGVTADSSLPSSSAEVERVLAGLLDRRNAGFLLTCWAQAHDEASLERVFRTAITNRLDDQAHAWTQAGVQLRRAESLLPLDARFTRRVSPGGDVLVGLAGGPEDTWQGEVDDLERAAVAVLGADDIASAAHATHQASATTDLVRAVLHGILTAAGGPVPAGKLLTVLRRRFPLPPAKAPKPVLVPSVDTGATLPGPEAGVLARDAADEIWQSLSPLDRALVPHLGQPPAELATVAGSSPEQAQAAATDLADRLREACRDDELAFEVLARVRQLCTERP